MNKVFATTGQVAVKNGGYLVVTKEGQEELPVVNEEFFKAQEQAEYIIKLAEKAKGKDFVGKKADSIVDIKAEVLKDLSQKDTEYLTAPKEVKQDLTKKLRDEALAFIGHKEDVSTTEKVNKFLQQFNIIKRFETVGLYFEPNDTELEFSKIYTIEEIVTATKEVIEILD